MPTIESMNDSFSSLVDLSFKFEQSQADSKNSTVDIVKLETGANNDVQNKERELAKIKSSASLTAANTNKNTQPATKKKYQHPKPLRQVLNYRFIKTLGQGSMGKVKLAEHNDTKQLVAIKIIPRFPNPVDIPHNFEYDPKGDERVLREAFTLSLLDHPFIVKCLDFLATKDYFYVVTEYVQGINLLDYMNQCHMTEDTARQVIRQLVSALDYCHQNHIVHRDLKMENMMLDTSNIKDDTSLKRLSPRRKSDGKDTKFVRIKLLDFGLANLYKHDRLLSTSCGSLYYAAPELLKSKNYIGPEIDIWSLGVCVYTLICGQVPFDGPNIFSLRAKIMAGIVEYPDNMSEECIEFLGGMLTVDPKQRSTLDEIKRSKWLQSSMQVLPKFVQSQEIETGSGSALTEFMQFLANPSKSQIKRRASNILNYVTNQSKSIQNFMPARVRIKDLAGQNPDPRIMSILTNNPLGPIQFTDNERGSVQFKTPESFGFGFDKLEVDIALHKALKSNGVMDDPIISTYYLLHEWFQRKESHVAKRNLKSGIQPQKMTEFVFLLESSDDIRVAVGSVTEKSPEELAEYLFRLLSEQGFHKNVTTFSVNTFISDWRWQPSYVSNALKHANNGIEFQIELVQILPTFEDDMKVKRYGLKCRHKSGSWEIFDRIADRVVSSWQK